jgi:hypothetical protein
LHQYNKKETDKGRRERRLEKGNEKGMEDVCEGTDGL